MKEVDRFAILHRFLQTLVVITILGLLSAVVIPNLGSFIGAGKVQAYGYEIHSIQTAVIAMLLDSKAGQLDGAVAATDDMDTITADSGTKKLSVIVPWRPAPSKQFGETAPRPAPTIRI